MRKIFVGNLSRQSTESDLYAAFSEFGRVEHVNIITDRDTGQPVALVEMTPEAADAGPTALRGFEGILPKLTDRKNRSGRK